MPKSCDFLVIGGGIVGLTVARELRHRHPDCSVSLIEKEPRCGAHASTRNSGVIHAGFYYTANSLKARFCVEGNRRLTEYCAERGLDLNRCGKLVVTRSEAELPTLHELARRGRHHGTRVELVSETRAQELEPRIHTVGQALYSPDTSSVDPSQVVEAIRRDAIAAGVLISTGVRYLGRGAGIVRTTDGRIDAGYVVNAAGLYADRVAHDFGFGMDYVILPFKGLFLLANKGTERLERHVYPVPDLDNQFHLGLHFTITVDGRTKIGPTAIPAFWREHYRGLDRFDLRDTTEIVVREAQLFVRNDFGFRALAVRELRKYSRKRLTTMARQLVPSLNSANFQAWGEPGIRAQLYDKQQRRLVFDFRTDGDDRSIHILNAVSPAFTCCLPFAEYVADQVDEHTRTN